MRCFDGRTKVVCVDKSMNQPASGVHATAIIQHSIPMQGKSKKKSH